jgi:uncharacterized protein (TIGR02145 family)
VNITRSLLHASLLTFAIIVLSATCTKQKETVTDADGNVYSTVEIGDQVWTVENLKTTKYNDGTPVPLITDRAEWITCDENAKPACSWYENDTVNRTTYGVLYNWYVVNTGKLAPKGWHVPTAGEWTELENYLITNGYNWDGTKDSSRIAKSLAATTDWISDTNPGTIGNDVSANNRSGFSALPGGFRIDRGDFYDIGTHGYWWSTTEDGKFRAWRSCLYHNKTGLTRHSGSLQKGCGFR